MSSPNKNTQRDFEKEYYEIFQILSIKREDIIHEWNNDGDIIKPLSIYETTEETPILSSHSTVK